MLISPFIRKPPKSQDAASDELEAATRGDGQNDHHGSGGGKDEPGKRARAVDTAEIPPPLRGVNAGAFPVAGSASSPTS